MIKGKLFARLIFAFLLGTSTFGYSNEAPDSVTKNAIDDLARYQQQASSLNSERKSAVRRVSKLLALSYDRLQTSSNQSHPVWQSTNEQYKELQKALDSMLNSTNGQTANTSSQSVSGSSSAAVTAPANNQSSQVPALVSGQRVRLKKLVRDMTAVRESISLSGPSTFQDPNVVQSRQKRFNDFTEALKRYPQHQDPDVVAAIDAYRQLQSTLQNEYSRAKQQLSVLGNVQQRLVDVDNLLKSYPVPKPMIPPFTEAQVVEWVEQAGNSRSVAEHAYKQLSEIAEQAYLPPTRGLPNQGAAYELADVSGLLKYSSSMYKDVQSNYQSMKQELERLLKHYDEQLNTRWQDDPDSDARYLFLDKDRQKEAQDLFSETEEFANSYIRLQSVLKQDASAGNATLELVSASREQFSRNVNIALQTSRMPEAVSYDPDMLKIAQNIVAEPDYEFGEPGTIVLTTDAIIDRERTDSRIDIDDVDVRAGGDLTFSGTETTWTYRWKEFRFAVPLKDDTTNEWHIWWISARKYSSGSENTPIGRWVSGRSTKGNQILEDYI